MGILSWLKHVTENSDMKHEFIDSQPLQFGAGEEMFQGLNMKDALDAHMSWTKHIERYLNNEEAGNHSIAEVSTDHNCVLGKWIHSDAKRKFGNLPDYIELREAHAEFHMRVGDVLNEMFNGNKENARSGLKKIRHQSGVVQLALIRLYAAAQND